MKSEYDNIPNLKTTFSLTPAGSGVTVEHPSAAKRALKGLERHFEHGHGVPGQGEMASHFQRAGLDGKFGRNSSL